MVLIILSMYELFKKIIKYFKTQLLKIIYRKYKHLILLTYLYFHKLIQLEKNYI